MDCHIDVLESGMSMKVIENLDYVSAPYDVRVVSIIRVNSTVLGVG